VDGVRRGPGQAVCLSTVYLSISVSQRVSYVTLYVMKSSSYVATESHTTDARRVPYRLVAPTTNSIVTDCD